MCESVAEDYFLPFSICARAHTHSHPTHPRSPLCSKTIMFCQQSGKESRADPFTLQDISHSLLLQSSHYPIQPKEHSEWVQVTNYTLKWTDSKAKMYLLELRVTAKRDPGRTAAPPQTGTVWPWVYALEIKKNMPPWEVHVGCDKISHLGRGSEPWPCLASRSIQSTTGGFPRDATNYHSILLPLYTRIVSGLETRILSTGVLQGGQLWPSGLQFQIPALPTVVKKRGLGAYCKEKHGKEETCKSLLSKILDWGYYLTH